MKTITKAYSLTEEHVKKLKALEKEWSVVSSSEAVRRCINLAFDKTLPVYVRNQRAGDKRMIEKYRNEEEGLQKEPEMTPEEKDMYENEVICEKMGGRVVKTEFRCELSLVRKGYEGSGGEEKNVALKVGLSRMPELYDKYVERGNKLLEKDVW